MSELRALALLLTIVALAALPAASVRAAEIKTGNSPSLARGERVDDDLYIFGGTTTVDGTVTRSLFVAGGTVHVSGSIERDVNVTGGNVTIDGMVGGSIRTAGGTIVLRGPVGWDVLAAGGSLTIGPEAEIAHDLRVSGGTVVLQGTVDRQVRGNIGSLTIDGRVGGDVRTEIRDQLRLGSSARIDGNLEYASNEQADIAPGATVAGVTVRHDPGWFSNDYSINLLNGLSWYFSFFLRLAWALLAGTLLVLLLPESTGEVAQTLRERPLVSLIWGAGLLVAVPILIVLLLVTVVGIPLALILTALYLIALYLSQVIVGTALGRLLLPASLRKPDRLHLWLAMLVGVTIVVLVRLLPLPFLWSFWTSLLVGLLALGALGTSITGLGRGPRLPPRPAAAGSMPAAPPSVE